MEGKTLFRQMKKRKEALRMDKSRLYYQTLMGKIVHVHKWSTVRRSGKGTWLVTLNQTGFILKEGDSPMIQEP